jgi:hypothetical protein
MRCGDTAAVHFGFRLSERRSVEMTVDCHLSFHADRTLGCIAT